MCVGNSKGTWALGPDGLTAKPKLGDSLTKALKKSWQDKGKVGAKSGGSSLRIPGSSGSGKVGGGSSAAMPSGNISVD